MAPLVAGTWERVFFDDFDGSSLDASKWTARTTASDGLGMYQAANVSVSGGMLRLRVDSNTDSASVTTGKAGGGPSPFLFGYGWCEARIRLPLQTSGQMTGAWHAFWLWGDNATVSQGYGPQEMDFEMRGSFGTTIRIGHVWQTVPSKLAEGIDYAFAPYDGEWHTYAYHWRGGQVDWYIDGALVLTYTTNLPACPLQILFDAKVGGSFAGAPDGNTTYPFYMDVDWVGVWQKADKISDRYYQRVTYGGTLDATQQARLLAAVHEMGAATTTSGLNTAVRAITAQDLIVRYAAPAALSSAEWANLLFRRLILDEATVLSNLTVTTYAGATWDARRQACKAALSL